MPEIPGFHDLQVCVTTAKSHIFKATWLAIFPFGKKLIPMGADFFIVGASLEKAAGSH